MSFPPLRDPFATPDPTPSRPVDPTLPIQGTDSDALLSRWSAVQTGYLHDPYIQHFVPLRQRRSQRRPPVINRGTWVRTLAIDALVERFLEVTEDKERAGSEIKRQVVSFGAGSDTRYWRLMERLRIEKPGKSPNEQPRIDAFRWHEIDFPSMIKKKAKTIATTPDLLAPIRGTDGFESVHIDQSAGTIVSPSYCLHALDLTNLPSLAPNDIPNLDPSLPTLFISECCLIYLPPDKVTGILNWITGNFGSAGLLIYEPILPHTHFGKMMTHNLSSRDITLRTFGTYPDLRSQARRFLDGRFTAGTAKDINELHDKWIPEDEIRRVQGVEMLDEVEEWKLLGAQYCISWGYKEKDAGVNTWAGWRGLEDK
ncbi:leucine carboxyl methyltransferase [Saitoella complicata NRRL Y-17804]|uniref:Leucine carboxyl methyltransferase 1 n=1 Tax=Saitoella complicata (strain BCRC 22490 / CBS 7301 / JCM 7358 / NBRC 10748 / NRRL Y-17804) TaxID=698492 RepID=A0A0E9NEH6_SAICN|nr:leucine carboxyl methyltransferase [Saitoella complicata NRRL Y-17804]ODQ51376.1 leucine carboxyl methyltransferase [Saitoella complicata NRRL Y-17804]GAO48257.1 hypothetical protein G7K_2437-t1 [Saitoella complicata NRRL Y-17804]